MVIMCKYTTVMTDHMRNGGTMHACLLVDFMHMQVGQSVCACMSTYIGMKIGTYG